MAETVAVKKRGGWLRKFAWALLILLVLLVLFYFVATSTAFFKGVILPKVGKSLNANVTVQDASIHPFSGVVLTGLKVETTGPEPVFQAKEIRTRYHLLDIIKGNINVEEAIVDSPSILIVQNPDGTSNLDPLTKGQEKKAEAEKRAPSAPSKAPQLNIGKVALNNATIRMVKNYNATARDVTDLTGLNFTLENLRNGQPGKLTLAGNVNVDNRPPAPATNSLMQGSLAGNFSLTPSADLQAASVNGNANFNVQKTAGGFSDLNALAVIIECDITPTDIKQLAVRFQKAGSNLGQLRVNGPFDMAKQEGRLTVQLLSIDRNVLNLAGAQNGIDFGPTVINSTNQVNLAKAGSEVQIAGALNIARLRVTRAQQTTPTLDLSSDYNLTVDTTKQSALINALNLNGAENDRPFLKGQLTNPMNIAWGNESSTMGDSAFKLNITSLNLADWRPFIGDTLQNGTLNMAANILSQQAGKQLNFDVSSDITELEVLIDTNKMSQTDIHFQTKGNAANLAQFNLQQLGLQMNHKGKSVLTFEGSGKFNSTNQTADMQFALNGSMPRIVGLLSSPDLSASSGSLAFNGRLLQQNATNRSVTGNFTLADFTARMGSNTFDRFEAKADLDVAMNGSAMVIRKANGDITQAQKPGGRFDVTGDYDTDRKSGQFSAKLIDFNENGLRPFLQSALGGKQLVSISVNATSSARLNPQGESSVKADFQMAKLVVSDPKQPAPTEPLEAKFQMDAGLKNQVADIRQFNLTLTPTPRARKNEMTLSGQVDMSQSNSTSANLKLVSESMDVTPYYDILAAKGEETRPAESAQPQPQPAAQTGPKTEPEAINIPLRNSTVNVNIGKFILREVEITNWLTTVKIDGGHVLLKPFQLSLNGAPVTANADLNLGVPGYQYDVGFSANRIPIKPLANSFVSEYKDHVKNGDLIANAQIKGVGITGVNLRKNLNGRFDFAFTNANIDLTPSKFYRQVLGFVALAIQTPELTNSPVNHILANATVGEGSINLAKLQITSEAYIGQSQGVLPIADDLNNSPINNWPLELSLKRSIAQKARMASPDTPTNITYVKLPVFVTVQGTLGDPKPNINKIAIAQIIAQATGLGGKAEKELNKLAPGLGNILGGGTGTNAPSTNANPIGNIIGNVLGGKTGGTNQPPSNTTNKPSRGLFDLLPK